MFIATFFQLFSGFQNKNKMGEKVNNLKKKS